MKKNILRKSLAWVLISGFICVQNSSYVLAAQESFEEEDELSKVSAQAAVLDDVDYKKTVNEVAAVLREAMKKRQESVTVGYISEGEEEEDIAEEIYNASVNHTGNPKEGDYLKFQCGGYEAEIRTEQKGEDSYLTLTYTLSYYTTVEQEKEVDAQIASVIENLGLKGETDYNKVCKIYDYICKNVSYDDEHLNDESYTIKNSAYGALVNKTAVCQGYALLFYRLSLECGVDTRIISGVEMESREAHAWNIVRLNNYYYNVDSTWDAQTESHREYFLIGSYNFSDHDEDMEYKMGDFTSLYCINSHDYNAENPDEGPVISDEPSGKCGENLTYTYDSEQHSLTIRGTGAMDNYDNLFDYAPWYSKRRDIQTISVEEGVTSIGDYAFASCASVESVSLPESIIKIGKYGFDSCTALKSITLPAKLERIEEEAFSGCKKLVLTSGTLPSSLTYLGESAFSLCKISQKIELPSGVTEIGDGAFYETLISEVVINGKETSIGDSAFENCANLTKVTINGSVSSIGCRTFRDSAVETIDFPKGLVSIGDEAFSWSDLSSIFLKEGLVSIGKSAFEGCESLKELSIPSTVTAIGYCAFPGITTLVIDEKNTLFSTENGILYNYDKTELLFAFHHETDETLKILDGVKTIDPYAFSLRWGLSTDDGTCVTEIIIPDSVTEIGTGAFRMMIDLKSVSFGKGLEKIDSYAFSQATSLETIYFNGSIPTIGDEAFEGDAAICYYPEDWDESIVSELGSYGGHLYWQKKGEPVLPRSGICGEEGDNVTWTIDAEGTMHIQGSGNMADYSSDFLQYSPWYSFRKYICKVSIEEGVTSVGAYAFVDSNSLKEISIADSVKVIKEGAFSESPRIQSVVLREGLETIDARVFLNSLEDDIDIVIPSTVTSIGDYAFSVWGTSCPVNVWFKGELPELGEKALLRMTIVYYTDSWESVPEDENGDEGFITYRKVSSDVFEQVGKPVTLQAPVQNKSQNTPNGVQLSWNAVDGASGYVVYRCEDFGPEGGYKTPVAVYLASTKDTTYLDTDVTSGDFLQYYVTAYNEEGVSHWGEDVQYQQITYLSQALITSIKNVGDGISLSWNAVEGAQGYDIYRKADGEEWQFVGTSIDENTLTYTDPLVSEGVTYTYGIQACFVDSGSDYKTSAKTITRISPDTSGGTTSSSSSTVTSTQKTKVKVATPKLTSVKNAKGKKLIAKWTKNTSANGYQIQYSTSSKFKSAKTVTVKKGKTVSKTISKLKKKKKYYVRVRAYKTVNGVKYYSEWSNKKSVIIKK